MAERSHLSIGEVLSLLREEFPDVTISKIRFLESQGLVDPERTPSGYRKFYDHDVERLRWILRQQRENFLPLKIIRGRLTEQGEDSTRTADDGRRAGDRRSATAAADAGWLGRQRRRRRSTTAVTHRRWPAPTSSAARGRSPHAVRRRPPSGAEPSPAAAPAGRPGRRSGGGRPTPGPSAGPGPAAGPDRRRRAPAAAGRPAPAGAAAGAASPGGRLGPGGRSAGRRRAPARAAPAPGRRGRSARSGRAAGPPPARTPRPTASRSWPAPSGGTVAMVDRAAGVRADQHPDGRRRDAVLRRRRPGGGPGRRRLLPPRRRGPPPAGLAQRRRPGGGPLRAGRSCRCCASATPKPASRRPPPCRS